MKTTRAISMVLLGVPLLALIASSIGMVKYIQEDVRALATQHLLQYPFLCEITIHEAGYARIALGLIGLVLLLFPFRKGDRSAWLALAIILLYQIKVFILPTGQGVPSWQLLKEIVTRPELPRMLVLNLVFPTMFLLGFIISLPSFWRLKHSPPT